MDVDAIPVRLSNGDAVPSLGGNISPQSSRLASVPLEVLLHINKYLTTPEYGHLRLTCKHIEDQLHVAFAKEFFSKRQFMFTEFSLQALVDISKSRFASSLKHVIFGLEQPELDAPAIAHRPNSGSQVLAMINRATMNLFNHSAFVETGRNIDMLAEAFSALPHLKTVGMRDFESQTRYRDGPDAGWTSYGTRTHFQETGADVRSAYSTVLDDPAFTRRVFRDILRSAGKASLDLQHFQVILRNSALNDQAFMIPEYLEPSIAHVLANLRTIFLDLTSSPPFVFVEKYNTGIHCRSYFLMKFLSRTVNLEHLRVNFRSYRETSTIMSWLSGSPRYHSNSGTLDTLPEEPPPVELKKLKQVDIGMTTVDPKVILAIICKHQKNLRIISLHKVSFVHAADVPADERVNLWAKFFEDLSKLELRLDAIRMSFLSQQLPGRQHLRHVSFKETKEKHTKNWAGSDTQSGLRDFQALVSIENLDKDSDIALSEGSDEEDLADFSDDVQDEGDD